MNGWKASVGRVVLFPVVSMSSSQPSALDLYRRVWGTDPDTFQRPPNPLMPSMAQGKRVGLMASCIVQQSRIDFTLTPQSSFPSPAQGSLPLIEDKSRLDAELLNIADLIGQSIIPNPIVRVAVNLQFLKVKASSVEANRELISVIPDHYGVKITDEEDFVFQINSPFSSRSADGVKMNSLTKWSVERIGILTLTIPAGRVLGSAAPTAAQTMPETKEFIAASVSFDSNNSPTQTVFPGQQQSSLLREALASIAQVQEDVRLIGGVPRC